MYNKINIIVSTRIYRQFKIVSDFDECLEDTDNCAQICINVIGRYLCSCDVGYRLASNNHDCDGIINFETYTK